MAEAVVSMVIGALTPLGTFMVQQAKFLNGVSDQVELAQSELLLMRGYLKDADARKEDDEAVRFWVNVVREAAYDLEDVIESFVLKVSLNRGRRSMKFACICKEGVHRYKIGSEIESITTKLSKLRLTMQSYDIKQEKGSEGANSFARQRERRLTYAHVSDAHDVVGIGKEVDKLSTHLLEESCCRIVSIWGMGGLGKTTLAKKVYNHEKVKYHFDCFAWVCVSQQFEGIAVMKEIFIKLSGAPDEQRKEIASLKSDEIAQKLYNFQRERKCLVVLDDIWTLDGWNSLKGGFPVHEETKSRIILTTRNKELASLANENGLSYESHALSVDDAWKLFQKIAFYEMDESHETDSEIKSKKEELGKEMLRHCAGLPLAIIVLAGLLSRKDTVGEWEIVRENVDVYIRRGTDLDREYKGQKYGGTWSVLALSYENLPYRLKLCFLYLCHFPEDYEIPVKQLIHLWMAEGFISSTSSEMLEDVSYSCLSELVGRCMIQVGQIGFTGKVKTCRLHDLMRDLCVSKAKEENFFHAANFSTGTRTNATQVGRVRRLAIYLNEEVDQLVPTTRDAHLRSLLYFGPQYFRGIWNKNVIRSVFNDFKLLRVLKLEDMLELKKLPSTIGNLVHLRFLSLKNSRVRNLPSSVANLVCLQTLDLRCGIYNIPNVFKKMEQLRHLYLPWYYMVRGELSLAAACNLQTLVNVKCGNCDFNALVGLYNLRKLSIQDWAGSSENWKKLEEFLRSRSSPTFHHLRSLSLRLDYGHDDSILDLSGFRSIYKLQLVGSSIKELPENLLSFPNLIKIKLDSTQLKGDQIEILEKLPHLRVLYLQGRVFSSLPSNTLVCSNRGFPNLEFLYLERLRELKEWRVEEGAMPRLRRLCINWCELRAVPDGLQYVATLKELTVKYMSSEFCSRLGEDGEDFHKIKHVPSLIITGTESRDLNDKRQEEWRKEQEQEERTSRLGQDADRASRPCFLRFLRLPPAPRRSPIQLWRCF